MTVNNHVLDILNLSREKNVSISLEGNTLKLKASKDTVIEKDFISLVQRHKEDILAFLQSDYGNLERVRQQLPPIEPVEKNDHSRLPLSYAQERIWFIDQLNGSVDYHISLLQEFDISLNKEAIESAILQLVDQHQILRTVIKAENGVPYQELLPSNNWKMEYLYLPDATTKEEVEALLKEETQIPFVLSEDYMLRAKLIRFGQDRYLLLLILHHIAGDGWSINLLQEDLIRNYIKIKEGLPIFVSPQQQLLQYADFASWQRQHLTETFLEQQLNYWKTHLDQVPPLCLRYDFDRPEIQKNRGAVLSFEIDQTLTSQLVQIAKEEKVTLFMLLLSAYKILLHNYSGQEDICVGTPVANRANKELEEVIGCFVNTLALRTDLSGNPAFTGLLQQVKERTLAGYENQEAPFEKVVELISNNRDLGRGSIFQVMFSFNNAMENATGKMEQLVDILASAPKFSSHSIRQTANFDLTLNASEQDGVLQFGFEYNTDLFQESTIQRMCQHFIKLLESIAGGKDRKLDALTILSQQEKDQILNQFNHSEKEAPPATNVLNLIQEQARNKPQKTALICGEESWTYEQMDAATNQLAHYLIQQHNIEPGNKVALLLDRNEWMIPAILAVLKTGATYVPIDLASPADRVDFILEDCNCNLLLDTAFLQRFLLGKDAYPVNAPEVEPAKNELAYIIYTSGSSGLPKGVMIEQQSFNDYVRTFQNYFSITADDVVLQQSSIGFDTSIEEIFPILASGGTLVMAKEPRDFDDTLEACKTHKVSVLSTNPYLLDHLNQVFDKEQFNFRILISGGDTLSWNQVSNLVDRVAVYNTYGPTESTVCATYAKLSSSNKHISIGRPIANRQVYILKAHTNQLQGIGMPGELCIAGSGLARGYVNQPDLSNQKFVSNPFGDSGYDTLYRTGDLACWREDGTIDFLGRIDEQVKIRGVRIELQEIEAIINSCEGVKQSICHVLEQHGEKIIIAYVLSEALFDRESIQSKLSSKLSAAMLPGYIMPIESIPLTLNGKINKKALPVPDWQQAIDQKYTAPTSATQRQLAEIWGEVLHLERVGISHNFFEIGGNSLLVMRVVAAIRKRLGFEISVKDFFLSPTIKALAEALDKGTSAVILPPIEVLGSKVDKIPLSFSQERLWFIDQLTGSQHYHTPLTARFSLALDEEALSAALGALVERHEILRTVIQTEDGLAYQEVRAAENWKLEKITLPEEVMEEELGHRRAQTINQAFDLAEDYPFRASLFHLTNREYQLVLVTHHIATDGWSSTIMYQELEELYLSFVENRPTSLKELAVQYSDYSVWQRNYLRGAVLDEKLDYWEQELQDLEPLNLPLDFPRSSVQSTKGDFVRFEVDQATSKLVYELCEKTGVTLYMLLLSVFKVLMYRYSNQTDICVGSVVANRPQEELEGLIGFFLNTIAHRTRLKETSSFMELLDEVKAKSIEIYQHQDAPFEQVVDRVVEDRDLSRNPLFQTMFALQNLPSFKQQNGSVKSLKNSLILDNSDINRTHSGDVSKLDLIFIALEDNGKIQFTIEYCTDLFLQETIIRLSESFKELLGHVLEAPDQKIADLKVLSAQQRDLLVHALNEKQSPELSETNLIDLFEKQAFISASDTAVHSAEQQLTYAELDAISDKLAFYLQQELDIEPGDLIGLMMRPSIWTIVSILGVWKSGAAYVPIELDAPEDRKNSIIEDTGIKALLIESENLLDVMSISTRIIAVDIQLDDLPPSEYKFVPTLQPEDLAYVLYTSGSTGVPKGVMVCQSSLVNYCQYAQEQYQNKDQKFNFPFFTPLSFDLTQTSILLPLLSGGTIFIETGSDKGAVIERILKNKQINSIKLTPSHIRMMEPGEASKHIASYIVGGEQLLGNHLQRLWERSPQARIFNEYGPTEATIGCAVFEAQRAYSLNKPVPIGRAIDHTQIYLLDEMDRLVPFGAIGELCVGGACLAKGYWNRPSLTKSKFISNGINHKSKYLYKTGDLARWLPTGELELIGRNDSQVKIRGHRVELGEIENRLRQHPDIEDAVVLLQDKGIDGQQLSAHYVRAAIGGYLPEKRSELASNNSLEGRAALYTLENGLKMYAYNRKELDFIYDEIFTNNVYLKNGLEIKHGACVVDIGANAGMFSILACLAAKDVTVYAYEPLPPTFELLEQNTSLYPGTYHLFPVGVSNKAETASFTYYPNATVLSTRTAEKEEVFDVVKQFIQNDKDFVQGTLTEEEMNQLLQDRLVTEEYDCELKTVSQIISENQLEYIDYLKIDVENEELNVLKGIAEEDWSKIGQIAIEVHDVEDRLNTIVDLLDRKGYHVIVNQSSDAKDTNLYDLYARVQKQTDTAVKESFDPNSLFKSSSVLQEELKTYLKSVLPDYMQPNRLIELEAFPITQNGKVDKKAILALLENSKPEKEYLAPRNELEEQLAAIWKDLLNLEQVGVADNFFELGGDSIISIQVVSRSKKIGLELLPKDIFDYPTIASLAACVEKKDTQIEAEQGQLTGSAPLLPIQRWFFEKNYEHRSHFNQSTLLQLDKKITTTDLSAICRTLVQQHDALRFKYENVDGQWSQVYSNKEGQVRRVDLTECPPETLSQEITAICEQYQRSLDIEAGELIRVVLIETPKQEENNRLFFVIHHLAVDGVSWRILLEQFQQLLSNLQIGGDLDLGKKSSSFRQWAAAMQAYAESDQIESQLFYWSNIIKQYRPLPSGKNSSNGRPSSNEKEAYYETSLDKDLTQQLITTVNQTLKTEINDILLAALLRSFSEWTGQNNIVIALEGHGREYISKELDTSNTLGWFSNVYPVLLTEGQSDIETAILQTKEQLSEIPNKGLGFGLLRYLHPSREIREKMARAKWDVLFNYLGQTDNILKDNPFLKAARESKGIDIHPSFQEDAKILVSGIISKGTLKMTWSYSSRYFQDKDIRWLAEAHIKQLLEVLSFCESRQEQEMLPAATMLDLDANPVPGFQEGEDILEF